MNDKGLILNKAQKRKYDGLNIWIQSPNDEMSVLKYYHESFT